MKGILFPCLFMSFFSSAKLVVTFSDKPIQQVVESNVFTENVNLNLMVNATLDYRADHPGIKAALGYEYFCEGDPSEWKNKDSEVSGGNDLLGFRIELNLSKPNRWDQWSSGSKSCLLTWKGSAIRTRTQTGANIAYSISGLGSSITFNYASPVAQFVEEGKKGPVTVPFTMIKPDQASGSFCEGNFE